LSIETLALFETPDGIPLAKTTNANADQKDTSTTSSMDVWGIKEITSGGFDGIQMPFLKMTFDVK